MLELGEHFRDVVEHVAVDVVVDIVPGVHVSWSPIKGGSLLYSNPNH